MSGRHFIQFSGRRKAENPPPEDKNGQRWLRDERISQVWFAGVHSNVGGGYPDDALAYLPLRWIMEEASHRGLKFKVEPPAEPDAFRKVVSACDKDGRQYDSRSGLGGYYRYGPRKIANFCSVRINGSDAVCLVLPKIHETAMARMQSDSNAYAPIGLPERYGVAMMDGRILEGDHNPFETPLESKARALEQEKIWNIVWIRRIVYFATLAASFHLIAFWLFHEQKVENEYSTPFRLISDLVRFVEALFPPSAARPWADSYATNPGSLLVGIIAWAFLIWFGSKLGSHITDSMRHIWKAKANESTIGNSALHWVSYRVRTSAVYETFVFRIMKRQVLPLLSAIALLWLGVMGTSRLLINLADASGAFCQESINTGSEIASPPPVQFKTSTICYPTTLNVKPGERYTAKIKMNEGAWKNGEFFTNPGGFKSSAVLGSSKLLMYLMLPQRRVLASRWFAVVARVGSVGKAEIVLDLIPVSGEKDTYVADIEIPNRAGELFLYVNDAIIPLPGLSDAFYWNNHGTAEVTIKRADFYASLRRREPIDGN